MSQASCGDFFTEVASRIQEFADARDWEQFHSPKNLSMALAGEAGELLEIFQWLTEDQSSGLDNSTLQAVEEEIADLFIYLVRLADKLDIDIRQAVNAKLELNEKKYPVDLARGNAKKYTTF